MFQKGMKHLSAPLLCYVQKFSPILKNENIKKLILVMITTNFKMTALSERVLRKCLC